SDGLNLSADKSWFMSGAYVDDVPLRDPGLSDKVAETYWARFLMLVEFVDQEVNNGVQLTNTWDYLDCRPWYQWYVDNEKFTKKTNTAKPYSPEYISSLTRAVRAIGRCFVGSPDDSADVAAWWTGVTRLHLKAVAELKKKPKVPKSLEVVSDEEGDGIVYVPPPKNDLAAIQARMHVFEEKMSAKEAVVNALGKRSDPAAQRERLLLAKMKQAHLASLLLLWHCGRLSDFRQVVVHWDIRKQKGPDGRIAWWMDPSDFKTKWRQSPADLDPGKILHTKVQEALNAFLKRWRPILIKHLGPRAKYNVTFTDEKFGEGAGVCFCLFPGYWEDNQAHTCVQHTFQKVLGCSERAVRKALGNELPDWKAARWGVDMTAIHQNFHHSAEVHAKAYGRGKRNQVNPLQAHVLKWGDDDA
ncbi:unnamed protein product, partial [Effrenium voratum]